MAWNQVTNLKGSKGDAATITGATAQSVAADQPAEVIAGGTPNARSFTFKVPRGLPGENAVPSDEATATRIAALDSQTRGALGRVFGRKVSVLEKGAVGDGTTLDDAAFTAAMSEAGAAGIVWLPNLPGATATVYRISLSSLAGSRIEADPGVVVKMPAGPDVKEWKLLTPLTIENTSHQTVTTKQPIAAVKNIGAIMAANVSPQHLDLKALDFTTFTKFGSTSVNNGNIGALALRSTLYTDRIAWGSAFDTGVVHEGATFVPEYGVYYEAFLTTTYTGSGQGARVSALTADGTHAAANVSTGSSTQGVYLGSTTFGRSGNFSFAPGMAVYTLPSTTGGVTLGFRLLDKRRIEYYSNGKMIGKQTFLQDVARVGWSINSTAPTQTSIMWGLSYGKGYVPQASTQCVVDFIGDSITYSAWEPTPWPDLLPIALHGLPGGGGAVVRQNLGVSSTKASDWGTAGGTQDVATKSFVGADYVCVLLGTNDGQDRPTADYLANLTYIADKIVADGAVPVFGMFPLWTNQAVSGVVGVTPAPPSQVQRLRHAMLNWIASTGYPVALVEGAFGDNILMLPDNIHPDARGMAFIVKAFAQAIARHRIQQIA